MSLPLGYRVAEYRPVAAWWRWWPLAEREFLAIFRTRWGVGLFFVCLMPTVIRLVMLLIVFGVLNFGPPSLRTRIPTRGGELGAIDPHRVEFYVDPVLQVMPGMVCALLLTTLFVARAIASDRTTNALELYWTRGISPWSYLLAKWVGSLLLMGTFTVAAPLTLWLTGGFLAEDWTLLSSTAAPFASALAGLLVATAAWTAAGVLLSAACRSPNAAMVLWCMLLVGTKSVGVVLARLAQEPQLRSCLSVWDAGGVVARAIAGLPQREASVPGAFALLIGMIAVLFVLARRRLRLVEAVG